MGYPPEQNGTWASDSDAYSSQSDDDYPRVDHSAVFPTEDRAVYGAAYPLGGVSESYYVEALVNEETSYQATYIGSQARDDPSPISQSFYRHSSMTNHDSHSSSFFADKGFSTGLVDPFQGSRGRGAIDPDVEVREPLFAVPIPSSCLILRKGIRSVFHPANKLLDG